MPTGNTTLLGLALPVQGELDGTWGNVVNQQLTELLDTAIAGTTTLSTDADVTLTTTVLAANQARQAILLWTANGTTTRNITAPAQSKPYIVINASAGTQSIVIRGAGPTTGVTLIKGEKALVAWNGTDFVKVASSDGDGTFTTVDTTNLEVTNIKAKDGTAAATIANTTGIITVSSQLNVDNLNLSANTISSTDANGNIVLAPNGTGDVQVDADTLRIGDANANATLTTNGTGDLILNTNSGTNSGSITIQDGVNGNILLAPNGTGLPIAQLTTAATNTVTPVMRLDSQSSGTPAVGIGVGLQFAAETAAGNTEVGATIEAVTTDVTAASEDFDLVIRTMAAGAAASEGLRVKNTGGVTIPTGSTYQINNTAVLSATTLGSGVTSSSLTSVGTIGTGTWQGTVIDSTYGGTGVNNGGRTLTLNTNSGTLAFGAASKTLTVNNSLTLAGTDATTMTFPTTSATIARTDAAQTFTGTQTVQAAATQDAVAIAGRAGGTGSFAATLTTATLSASVTHTLPAITGTLATLANTSQTFAGVSTFSNTFTLSGTTTNIALGTSQTTGTWTAGGAAQTGTITLDQSTKAHTLNIGTGATENATTKTLNLGTAGVSGSTTNLNYGSAVAGSTVTHIWNAGGERMRLTSAGNVGIGASSPDEKLVVSGGITTAGQAAANKTSAGTVDFYATDNATRILSWGASGVGGSISFWTGLGGSGITEKMRIDNAGRVGIGATPAGGVFGERLQVSATTSTTASASLSYYNYNLSATSGSANYHTQYLETTLTSGFAATGTTYVSNSQVINLATGATNAVVAYSSSYTDIGSGALTTLYHFSAAGAVLAGGTVANQAGFIAGAGLVDATNNYGFYGNIASGTGRWNFYAAGTANNYFAGPVQLGAGTAAAPSLTAFGDTNTGLFYPAADTVGVTTGGTERVRVDSSGNVQVLTGAVVVYQPAPASIATTATLTNANIQTGIINTTGTSYTVTMPLGTTLETLVTWAATNLGYDFSIINTASGTITMAANTGVTTLGALTIATGTSAQFRIRRTAANTFVLYRLS